MNAARKMEPQAYYSESASEEDQKIHTALLEEDERHEFLKMIILHGWSQAALGRVYGVDIRGTEYDRRDIQKGARGNNPELVRALLCWMKTHPGPRFNKVAQLKDGGAR